MISLLTMTCSLPPTGVVDDAPEDVLLVLARPSVRVLNPRIELMPPGK
jgi:hypothetical protein